MKCLTAILLLAAVASASQLESFRSWALTHGKVYTGREEARRFAIFKQNLATIELLNLEHPKTQFGVNKFADLTNEEFAAIYASGLNDVPTDNDFEVEADSNADEADYTYMLPAIKDQAQCGSCWAFSAVVSMEAQTYLKHGKKVVSLSEQELVSCDKTNLGCNGGNIYLADAYAVKHGMASESAYPYVSGTGSVPACKSFTPVAEFSSYKHFGRVSSDATLMTYLDEYGPLSIAIEADKTYFQYYTGGILDEPTKCGTSLDHGVALVGYGTESGENYWLVRNSWGKSWGDSGYVKLIRGKNMCGMNSDICAIVA